MSESILVPNPGSHGPLELRERKRLVQYAPVKAGDHVLDLGVGNGYAVHHFLSKGCHVCGIGIDIDRADHREEMDALRARGAEIREGTLSSKWLDVEWFDVIWCAHVIEHTISPGLMLHQIKFQLKREAWLCIVVPPYRPWIWHGHMIGGWSLGQLIYLLLMAGFDVKNGHFGATEHNVWGFVQKATQPLPKGIRMGKGDLKLLQDYFPMKVVNGIDGAQWNAINWPPPWEVK